MKYPYTFALGMLLYGVFLGFMGGTMVGRHQTRQRWAQQNQAIQKVLDGHVLVDNRPKVQVRYTDTGKPLPANALSVR